MKQQYVYGLAAFFAIVGLSIFGYKWQVLGFPVTKNQQTPVWTIESSIGFDSGPGSIKVNLHIPTLTPGFRMINENSVSRGYGFSVNYGSGGREAQWAIRRADGHQRIYYRISVYEDSKSDQSDTTPPFPPPPVIIEPFKTAVDVIVADVKEHSADTASFTAELLRMMNDASPGPNVELVLSDASTRAEFVDSITTILASARIPARMIHGFELQGRLRSVDPITWLEVHDGDRWRYFDPLTGDENLPEHFLIWWRGNEPLIDVAGGSNVEVGFAIQENHLDAVAIAETQVAQKGATMIGALVMVLLRNMIGIDAFGTFMPVLIALAFRETQLVWGVILFTMLVALGLSIRFLLERLRLLLVPRLSAVLIIVVILMLLISMVSHRLGMETGLSVALFPMVIIAMTIERMSVVWEERGASDAIRAGLGSLVVAVAAYVFMGLAWLEHLLFTFPELLLVVLSLVVLAGRYTGYRLVELSRFKALMGR